MDVVVHVLALEQHVGRATVDIDLTERADQPSHTLDFEPLPKSASAAEFFSKAHTVDWVAHSATLSELAHEASVLDRATAFAAGDRQLDVQYAPGGQLVDGAVDAALGLFFGVGVERTLGAGRPIDRSIQALRASGWTHSDLRSLLHRWAILDPESAVVLLAFDHDDYTATHHELTCRYDVVHTEYDFLSKDEASQLGSDGSGSVHTVLLRADADHLAHVLERHRGAVAGSYVGEFAVLPLVELWSPLRTSAPDASHAQRIRKIRRKERISELVDRVRSR